MIFLSVEEVIQVHDELINIYGGLPGIRDLGLLISSVEMPKAALFEKYLHESVFDKASAYLYHIVCNHAFLDGNKRTGAACALIFLNQNGIQFKYDIKILEEIVCMVAQRKISKDEISEFFQHVS